MTFLEYSRICKRELISADQEYYVWMQQQTNRYYEYLYSSNIKVDAFGEIEYFSWENPWDKSPALKWMVPSLKWELLSYGIGVPRPFQLPGPAAAATAAGGKEIASCAQPNSSHAQVELCMLTRHFHSPIPNRPEPNNGPRTPDMRDTTKQLQFNISVLLWSPGIHFVLIE